MTMLHSRYYNIIIAQWDKDRQQSNIADDRTERILNKFADTIANQHTFNVERGHLEKRVLDSNATLATSQTRFDSTLRLIVKHSDTNDD